MPVRKSVLLLSWLSIVYFKLSKWLSLSTHFFTQQKLALIHRVKYWVKKMQDIMIYLETE